MKKFLSLLLILSLMLSTFFVENAFAATSASFDSNRYCTVTISQKLMQNLRYKTATVKINTYDLTGKKTSGKVNVKLTDGKGNYIGTYTKKSGDTIKLGNDHSSYRIYISVYKEPVTGGIIARTIKGGNNFTNLGKCATWKITNNKNCSIK
ncbi:MAG: hypothetical protein J6K51_00420 [Clostridia bacterium]|nr:hypothetical protein [Clostridia bacterium]